MMRLYFKGDRVYWSVNGEEVKATVLGHGEKAHLYTILVDGYEASDTATGDSLRPIHIHWTEEQLAAILGNKSPFAEATEPLTDAEAVALREKWAKLMQTSFKDLLKDGKIGIFDKNTNVSPKTDGPSLSYEDLQRVQREVDAALGTEPGEMYLIKVPKGSPGRTRMVSVSAFGHSPYGIHITPGASYSPVHISIHSFSEEMSRRETEKTKPAPWWMEGYANVLGLIRMLLAVSYLHRAGLRAEEDAEEAYRKVTTVLLEWVSCLIAFAAFFFVGWLFGRYVP